jgi:hypothetical protein
VMWCVARRAPCAAADCAVRKSAAPATSGAAGIRIPAARMGVVLRIVPAVPMEGAVLRKCLCVVPGDVARRAMILPCTQSVRSAATRTRFRGTLQARGCFHPFRSFCGH